jgi:hypothetical protein
VGVTLLIGVSIQNFSDFLNLVSSVTNSFTSFVFPCLFYVILFWHDIRWYEVVWNVVIIVAALLGFAFGGYGSLSAVVCDLSDYSYGLGQNCTVAVDPLTYSSCF